MSDTPERPSLSVGLASLFVLSGASGLVFEVIWVRQLGHWVGQGTIAVSLVVAAFLVGLLLGSRWGGASADRHAFPLRRYAWLEALTGLSAFAVSLLLAQTGALSVKLAEVAPPWMLSSLFRQATAFVVLLPPTALMGATLPTLLRHVARSASTVGASMGALYALNTFGAALGCGLAGFWSIGALGLLRTALLAAAGNLVVAAVAAVLARKESPIAEVSTEVAPTTAPTSRARIVGAIAALSGCAAIGCEVLWFRGMHAFVKSSTYAFSLLLVVYLLGIVVGGALYGRRLAAKPARWALLADTQLLLAAAVLGSVALLGRAGTVTAFLGRALGAHADSDNDGLHALLGLLVVAPPAALMGVSYPLVATLATEDDPSLRGLGRRVGGVGGLNTLGGAIGSLTAAIVLVPRLGLQGSFLVMVLLTLLAALLAAREAGALAKAGRMAAALLVVWALLPRDYLLRATTTFPRSVVLEVREGRDGTATVLEYTRESVCAASPNHCQGRCTLPFRYDQLLFGTISYASTIPPARRYMRALAHLPMLMRGEARTDVLEICFGTGTTAGAFTTHPTLGQLTVVDINPDVFALARHFAESNLRVWAHPRTRLIAEDGRHHLATTTDRYDIVSLEPPPPTAEGAASLYTLEFYQQARRRMRDGGMLAQWIPLDQQTVELNRAMLASMRAVFPYVELYIPARLEGVVLASDRPLTPNLATWDARFNVPAVRDNLQAVGFADAAQLAATRIYDTAGVDRFVRGEAPVRDDRPTVEFYRTSRGPAFRLDAVASTATPLAGLDAASQARVARYVPGEVTMMRAWDRHLGGDTRGAEAAAREAHAQLGTTPYTEYLVRLEHGCLDLDAP